MKDEKPLLGEFLKGLPPRKRIRIGTKPGAKPGGGFIYEGTVKDLNLADLYKQCSLDFIQKIQERLILFATSTDHKKMSFLW